MGYLIDTCLFIDHERQKKSFLDFLDKFPNQHVAISVITAAELLHGVHRANKQALRLKRKAFVETIISEIPILDFDLKAARIYSEVWAKLLSKGMMISAHDLQIGSTALCHGLDIVTSNKKDFIKIPGVKIIEI